MQPGLFVFFLIIILQDWAFYLYWFFFLIKIIFYDWEYSENNYKSFKNIQSKITNFIE